jgi:hypothetical protein
VLHLDSSKPTCQNEGFPRWTSLLDRKDHFYSVAGRLSHDWREDGCTRNRRSSHSVRGGREKDQTPYRFHSLNHGLFAYISSCLRLAAQRSDNWSGLVSGTKYSCSSHSISAIAFSRFMLSTPSDAGPLKGYDARFSLTGCSRERCFSFICSVETTLRPRSASCTS